MATKVHVKTSGYWDAHGHMPSGTVQWIFEIGMAGKVGEEIMRFASWTDAKHSAVRWAEQRDYDTVRLQPQSGCKRCLVQS